MRVAFFAILAILAFSEGAFAQTVQDPAGSSLSLRFRVNRYDIDFTYADNQAIWDRFEREFRKQYDGRNSAGISWTSMRAPRPKDRKSAI